MSSVMRCLAAAVVVLLLSACSDDGGETVAQPTQSVSPSPSPPTESTTPPGPMEFTFTICCRGDRVDPGAYALPSYVEPPLTVRVPKGWRVINERGGQLFALVQGKNDIGQASRWLTILPAGEVSEKEVVRSLLDMKQLDFDGKATAVTVLGQDATQLDALALPNPAETGTPNAGIAPGTQSLPALAAFVAPGFAMTTSSAEARLRFLVVSVESGTLLLSLEAPADEFKAFLVQANRVMDGLKVLE